MKKSLVIVESPAKAKTIAKFLGNDFIAASSYGHVRDLPKKAMGVDLGNNFKPTYTIIPGKEKIIRKLKDEAKGAEKIFLATDPDREGEAISWHLSEVLGMDSKIKRAVFYEVTKDRVLEAISHPGDIEKDKVLAQQARRILDRIVGYKISPILWEKISRGLSAGRVQSVAMRLILEREEKITNFVAEEYWTITARLKAKNDAEFEAKLFKINGEKADIKNGEDAKKIIEKVGGCDFTVVDIEKGEEKRNAPAPFTTSLLQQESSKKLRFTSYRTMRLAQELYEGIELGAEGPLGLITYMRTDSFRINKEFQNEARLYIKDKFGEAFVPESPNYFPPRKGAQEAHEAIRPTSLKMTPELVKPFLRKDQWNLYDLIWSRFLASQMSPAILDETQILIEADACIFRTQGTAIKFPGFKAVYEEAKEDEEKESGPVIPLLSKGEKVSLLGLIPEQHFTKPPSRYSEAMLVKALEEEGIGRPSTYASIIQTLDEREYVKRIKRRLYPTELGLTVTGLLIENFPKIMDIKFTAGLETQLDTVEEGRKDWVDLLREFYGPFAETLKKAEKDMRDLKHEKVDTEIKCLRCGEKMVLRWGRHGKFLACSTYPKCRHTQDLEESGANKSGLVCKKCGGELLIKNGKFGRFLACVRYPDCKFTQPMAIGLKCPKEKCGGEIIERKTKRGRTFYGCSNFPRCEFFSWTRPDKKENKEKD